MRSNAVTLDPKKYREAACRSCKAPIFWAFTPGRKKVPVDLEPIPFGTYVVVGAYEGVPQLGPCDDADPAEDRFVSHFRTCPEASSHRRKAKR